MDGIRETSETIASECDVTFELYRRGVFDLSITCKVGHVILYSKEHWWHKILVNLKFRLFGGEKGLANGLTMANGYQRLQNFKGENFGNQISQFLILPMFSTIW